MVACLLVIKLFNYRRHWCDLEAEGTAGLSNISGDRHPIEDYFFLIFQLQFGFVWRIPGVKHEDALCSPMSRSEIMRVYQLIDY